MLGSLDRPPRKWHARPVEPGRFRPDRRHRERPRRRAVPDNAAPLRGASARIAERMDESLTVPTATSVRSIPAKLLEVNRKIINNQLRRLTMGGKVSFTHLIGWATVQALKDQAGMNVAYADFDDQPHMIRHETINLGLAIDVQRKDGSRTLLVPNIKGADQMDFQEFWLAYEELVHRVRSNKITPEDFAGTTVSLTNPGTIGTVQSVPRLMPDHGLIVGVGAINYPPEYSASDPRFLARMGIGRVITLTSTYDHRVIQGAQSGLFLARVHELLLGEGGFLRRHLLVDGNSVHPRQMGSRRQSAGGESRLGGEAGPGLPDDQHVPGARPSHRRPRSPATVRVRSCTPSSIRSPMGSPSGTSTVSSPPEDCWASRS